MFASIKEYLHLLLLLPVQQKCVLLYDTKSYLDPLAIVYSKNKNPKQNRGRETERLAILSIQISYETPSEV